MGRKVDGRERRLTSPPSDIRVSLYTLIPCISERLVYTIDISANIYREYMKTLYGVSKEYKKTRETCHGKGYIMIASTSLEDTNDEIECETCEGLGEVELSASEIF
jgi:DnaJ-class molecular chaperone